MRIEKLNNNKIKVTLTTMDLINLNIDVEQLAPDSKELHTFLFHIMETIKEETGFNPYNGQVIVEATPSQDGISILVSKIAGDAKKITKDDFKQARGVKAKVREASASKIFYFTSFEDICMALAEVPSNTLAECLLYKLHDTYCFIVKKDTASSICHAVMTEFAVKSSESSMRGIHIREHGELIAQGSELVLMAKELRNFL